MPILEPTKKSVKEIMDSLHHIPPLQREYDWGQRQASRLYNDLNNFSQNLETLQYYFLGSMIVYRESEEDPFEQVVDGQQRLASICLLHIAIRDYLIERKTAAGNANPEFDDPRREGRSRGISDVISKADTMIRDSDDQDTLFIMLKEKDANRLLWLSNSNIGVRTGRIWAHQREPLTEHWDAEKNQYVLGKAQWGWIDDDETIPRLWAMRPERNDSNDSIYEVYDAFFNHLRESFDQTQLVDAGLDLWKLMSAIHHNTWVIKTEVDGLLAAFQIFETINTTGTPLSMLDIIRARLLSRAAALHRGGENNIHLRIKEAIGSIANDEILNREQLTQFTRRFWISREARKMTNRVVQSNIVAYIEGIVELEELLTFSTELRDASIAYRSLIDPYDSPDLTPESRRNNTDLRVLNRTVEAHLPFLLTLRLTDWYSTEREPEILRLIESAWIMHNLCLRGKWNAVDILYANLCNLKYDTGEQDEADRPVLADITDMETLKTVLVEKFNHTLFSTLGIERNEQYTEERFVEEFGKLSILRTAQSDIILRQFENHTMRVGREIARRGEVIEVEHILPKKPSDGWFAGLFTTDEEDDQNYYRKYIHRISNQTLIDKKLNNQMKNRPFDEKKPDYRASQITMSNELAELDDWGPEQIEERGRTLAQEALEIWPLISLIKESLNDAAE